MELVISVGLVEIYEYGIGNHCNPIIISKSQHADLDRLYLVGGNMMTELGYFNDITNLELRKKFLKRAKYIIKEEEKLIKETENNNKY